jgi:exosortase
LDDPEDRTGPNLAEFSGLSLANGGANSLYSVQLEPLDPLRSVRRWLRTNGVGLAMLGYGACVGSLFFALYWAQLRGVLEDWWRDLPGLFAKLVALAVLVAYAPWRRVAATPARTSLWGLTGVAVGCGLFLGGQLMADLFVARASIVVAIGGLIWTFGGAPRLRTAAFPLLFSMSSIPLPLLIAARLIAPIQRTASDMAVQLTQIAGATASKGEGFLDLSGLQVGINQVCGNLRMLGPLLVVSLAVGTIRYRSLSRRILLFVLALPLAAATDMLRIVTTALLAGRSHRLALAFHGWMADPMMCAAALAAISACAVGARYSLVLAD